MPDTTGTIRKKSLDGTGLTEDMIAADWSRGANRSRMVIAEIRTVEPHGPSEKGKKRIDYVMDTIEPVPEAQEEAVRELQRAIYRTRPEVEGQETLNGTSAGPTVQQATDAVSAHVERDDEGQPVGVWDGDTNAPAPDPAAVDPEGAAPATSEDGDPDAGEDGPDDGPDGPWPGDPDFVEPDA